MMKLSLIGLMVAATLVTSGSMMGLALAQTTAESSADASVVDGEDETKRAEADRFFDEAFNILQTGQWQEAVELLEQALVLYREVGDRQDEGKTLIGLGKIADVTGQYAPALDYYHQGLGIAREIGDRITEGATLNNIGLTYSNLGNYSQALDYYQQALTILDELSDRVVIGSTLNNMGLAYERLGDYPQALDHYQQALGILREIGDRATEGVTLSNIGSTHDKLGDYPQALDYYQQALQILRDIGDRTGEGGILNNMGATHYKLGDYPEALDSYRQSLEILREMGDSPEERLRHRAGEGVTLNNIGSIYSVLGDDSQALDYYRQALEIRREIGDRTGEGTSLNNIGLAYDSLDDYPQALDYYQQALEILREIGNRAGEGTTLNNMGLAYDSFGDHPQALDYYQQALALHRDIGDRAGEGQSLNNMGLAYSSLNDYPQALDYYQRSLGIRREIGDRSGEAATLNNIGWLLDRTNEPELAIIFLKQSVTTYEEIRVSNRRLDDALQDSYTETVVDTYRKLADLLLRENRVLEAQAVLDLLRTQELDDYFQDVRSSTAAAEIDYWQPEERILTLYQEFLQNATELAELRAKPFNDLTPEEQDRLRQLVEQEGELRTDFTAFVDNPAVREDIAALRQAETGDIELDALLALQDNIKSLPNAAILYPLIFEDRLELILIPSNAPPIRRRVDVTAADLNRVIGDYRHLLRLPTRNAKPTAQRLYQWVIGHLQADLDALDIQTIVYSPDGALRYIPLAALYDGDQWLAERYAITHITNHSTSDLSHIPIANPRILAGACATCSFTHTVGDQPYPFSDLPFTRDEVTNLAAQVPGTDVLIDQDFSRAETELRLGSYTIIHLATHGAFVSSSPNESFLMFGDGQVATLTEIKSWPLSQADLVVLSACETGLGGQDLGNGIEVLGIGFQLERAGAKAAIASLWQVSDGGTQNLMDAFYTALNNGHGKAEALRRAQIALIRNNATVLAPGERGLTLEPTDSEESLEIFASSSLKGDLDHPYYWAPFILIGNGL